MRFGGPVGRRAFLRSMGMSAGLLALSRLQALPAASAVMEAGSEGLRVLSAADARVLSAISERITQTDDPAMPDFHETQGLKTIDTALLQLPEETRWQLHWALRLFENGPLLFVTRFSTFTGLEGSERDRYLQAWSRSRFETCRLAFRAFKNLSMLGYYAQDATWKGIHYQGPWVPRPRRIVSPES